VAVELSDKSYPGRRQRRRRAQLLKLRQSRKWRGGIGGYRKCAQKREIHAWRGGGGSRRRHYPAWQVRHGGWRRQASKKIKAGSAAASLKMENRCRRKRWRLSGGAGANHRRQRQRRRRQAS